MTPRNAPTIALLLALLPLGCSSEDRDSATADADASGGGDVASATRDIARQGERHNVGWRLSNADSIVAVYAPDVALMFADAPDVDGRDAVRQMLSTMFDSTRVESLEVQTDTIEVHGSSAMEWGTYTEAVKPVNGNTVRFKGRYVLQWKLQPDGTWAIRRFTGNLLEPPAM